MKRTLLKLFKMNNSVNQENYLTGKKLFTNDFQVKTLLILVIVSFFSFTATAQNDDKSISTSNEATIESNFNLAPGMVYSPKKVNLVDYSFMLEQIPVTASKNFKNDDFLKVIPKEKLDYWKSSEPKVYQYYADAKSFYDNLSDRVKSVLSVEVLWHIYFYDVKLKNQLQAIQ